MNILNYPDDENPKSFNRLNISNTFFSGDSYDCTTTFGYNINFTNATFYQTVECYTESFCTSNHKPIPFSSNTVSFTSYIQK